MKTTDFVRDKEEQIINHFGFYVTSNKHIDCPICEKLKKFRIGFYNKQLRWICTCGNGDLFSLLTTALKRSFADICKEIDRVFGNTQRDFSQVKKQSNYFEHDFKTLGKLQDTNAELYLQSRNIKILPKSGIRLSEQEYHKSHPRYLEALYAIATDDRLNPCYIHKTYLDGAEKLDSEQSKMIFKIKEGQSIAVRMFASGACLGISEGIETGLSAAQIDHVPVWAALNTAFLKSFKAPAGVKTLIVYADNDTHGAGLSAAFECGNKNILANNDVQKVIIKWPECKDWNDYLTELGKRFEWVLTK